MQEKGIISTHQFVWMLFIIITSFTALQVPGLLILHSHQDAWLAILGAWLLDVLLAIVYAYMGIRFPGENFIQYSQTILGKYIGKIIGILFPLYFILICSILMRALALLLSNAFIPEMPISVPLTVCYLIIAYAVKNGIESMARVSEILGPLYFFSFIVLFILLAPLIKLDNLKPQLYEGFYPALTGTPFMLSFIGICIMMSMYIPICNKPENGFLAKFIAVTMGSFAILIIVVTSIGVFGIDHASIMVNPGLQLTKYIQLGNFFERVEIIWMSIAVGAGIMTGASLIWASSLGISQVVELSSYKPLVYPVVLISFALSITSFESDTAALRFVFYSYPFLAIFVQSGLELFLFVMALLLKKRGSAT
ncbi:spore germination protein (amino acid permease) [Anaerovirgula multivorans]|uniref:Spore germination protein (Amino acid permease) n=1 Tax=Anaerovirgula multivorans TaxID=312168 RepID=A0A238ZW75_9FIRM|nr:endospore germination permease [Anaerovirgula multivorans]SNR87615.1 spore germination protein (amino acid permease) [Anaerovirgula multivorans]